MLSRMLFLLLMLPLCVSQACSSSGQDDSGAGGSSEDDGGEGGDGEGGDGEGGDGEGGEGGGDEGGRAGAGNGGSGGSGGASGGAGNGGKGGSGGGGGTGGAGTGGQAAGGSNAPGTENLRACGTIEPDKSHAPFEAIKKLHSGQGQVKILVYGQSISEGAWWSMVRDWLKATYPKGQLVMEEHARGGCAAQCLIGEQPWFLDGKTENRLPGDVYAWSPDLILFHVYGSHTSYEKIVQGFKQNTTAQVLLQTDHRTTDNPQANGDTRWSQTMSTMYVPSYAKTYGFSLARIWEEWFAAMQQENKMARFYLEDDVHLNAEGNKLMARLIERHLCYNPAP